MVRMLGVILLMFSWLVLLAASLGALVGGWLYFGYIKIECHPMFARAEAGCSMLQTWASEHVMIAGRAMLPYRQVLTDQQNRLILLAGGAMAAALLIQVVHRVVRRRRQRRLGVFADVQGFRPIDLSVDP
jgi:hypothetical protein